jgi:hypothetical protein
MAGVNTPKDASKLQIRKAELQLTIDPQADDTYYDGNFTAA